jgi:hypothetical protein
MYNWLSSTVQLPGASLASVDVLLTLLEKFETNETKEPEHIHDGVYRVAQLNILNRVIDMKYSKLNTCTRVH